MSRPVPTDMLEMSDEDFLNMNHPPEVAGGDPAPVQESEPEAELGAETATPLSEVEAEGGTGADPEGGEADPTESADGEADAGQPNQASTTEPKTDEADGDSETPGSTEGSETDYKAFYEQIMKPFKANGKMIELRDPSEAIALMQMGANYTRKSQELKPYRSALQMLQNNNLLDPDKLSFLIDLDKGDPEAIKKFIKDRGIDPLDIDTSTDPAYLGGNHQVSEKDVVFRDALEELSSAPGGSELIHELNANWDNTSKEMLYQNPEVMGLLRDQRESGVYAMIADEVERQITLGILKADVPFLQAYMQVGDALVREQQAQTGSVAKPGNASVTPTGAGQPQVLGTSVAAPKSQVGNGDRAAAASPSRGTAAKVKAFVNPLSMADDDFLTQMENRV